MQIAVVYSSNFAEISPGGIQNYIKLMSREFSDNDQVTYFGLGDINATWLRRNDKTVSLGSYKGTRKTNLVFALLLRKRVISDFDLVIFHRADNLLAARVSRNSQIALFLHGGTMNAKRASTKRTLFGSLYLLIEILARLRSDVVLSVDPENIIPKKLWRQTLLEAPAFFDRTVFNSEGVATGREDFAIIGRLSEEKQFEVAIRAFNEASVGKILHVIGSGSQMDRLKQIAGNPNVYFHGSLEAQEVGNLLKERIRALIITSKFEGFPLVALEARACACQVIAMEAPGLGDRVRKTGARVVATYEELVQEIRDLNVAAPSMALEAGSVSSDEWRAVLRVEPMK